MMPPALPWRSWLMIPVAAAFVLQPAARAQSRIERTFEVGSEAEAVLELTAAAPATSWTEKGREAAAAAVLVDGRYQQDIVLFAGPRNFTYSLLLGRLAPGRHTLRVEHNPSHSAEKASTPEIKDARVTLFERSNPEFQALAHAPILFARPNSIDRFTDLPILSWYEVDRQPGGTSIRYSIIFTNEDGGTQTNALMARWGRTTDIEWMCEAKFDAQGRLAETRYQGKDHESMLFQGKRESDHPLFIVASNNNIFADEGSSAMRFALRPSFFDLSQASREEVMFRNPWTFQLMAAELKREDKLDDSSRVGQKIADPRRYLYIQAGAQQDGAAMSFGVKLKGDRRWYTSDIGINYYKVDRSEYFQTTIRLPAGATLDMIERLAVRCDVAGDPRKWEEIAKAAGAKCELKAVNRVYLLSEDYLPGPSLPLKIQPVEMNFGDMIELYEKK